MWPSNGFGTAKIVSTSGSSVTHHSDTLTAARHRVGGVVVDGDVPEIRQIRHQLRHLPGLDCVLIVVVPAGARMRKSNRGSRGMSAPWGVVDRRVRGAALPPLGALPGRARVTRPSRTDATRQSSAGLSPGRGRRPCSGNNPRAVSEERPLSPDGGDLTRDVRDRDAEDARLCLPSRPSPFEHAPPTVADQRSRNPTSRHYRLGCFSFFFFFRITPVSRRARARASSPGTPADSLVPRYACRRC